MAYTPPPYVNGMSELSIISALKASNPSNLVRSSTEFRIAKFIIFYHLLFYFAIRNISATSGPSPATIAGNKAASAISFKFTEIPVSGSKS